MFGITYVTVTIFQSTSGYPPPPLFPECDKTVLSWGILLTVGSTM